MPRACLCEKTNLYTPKSYKSCSEQSVPRLTHHPRPSSQWQQFPATFQLRHDGGTDVPRGYAWPWVFFVILRCYVYAFVLKSLSLARSPHHPQTHVHTPHRHEHMPSLPRNCHSKLTTVSFLFRFLQFIYFCLVRRMIDRCGWRSLWLGPKISTRWSVCVLTCACLLQ